MDRNVSPHDLHHAFGVATPEGDPVRRRAWSITWWCISGLVFATVILIRLRLLGIPLERDEGEYAYSGQLMLQGILPYQFAYSMKFPGTSAAYGLIMLAFGQTTTAIHLGLLLVNAASVVLIFLIGKCLMNSWSGLVSAASYAVLALNPSVLGLAGHATHFVMLPLLIGILLLVRSSNDRTTTMCLSAGLMFGFGLLMKQPAAFFIFGGAIYLLFDDFRWRRGTKAIGLHNLAFIIASVVPIIITCVILRQSNVWDRFWFWTIDYAREYAREVPPLHILPSLFGNAALASATARPLWLLAAAGLITGFWNQKTRNVTWFSFGFLICSILAVYCSLHFRQHYFILMLAPMSLLIGIAINNCLRFSAISTAHAQIGTVVLWVFAVSWPFFVGRSYFFQATPIEACRILYGENPFPESVKIGEFLRSRSNASDTIAILGSEPQIYFYSRLRSATGYIYMYGLTEKQPYASRMQQEMVQEITVAHPRFLVFVGISKSWLWAADSEPMVVAWANEYAAQNYNIIGLVNLLPEVTQYYLANVPPGIPQAENCILIYERKPQQG